MPSQLLIIRDYGQWPYLDALQAMDQFTNNRQPDSDDEFWVLEHPAVFTLGQAGDARHLLNTGQIPVIKSNRGGQVTYHGPGQVIVYLMLNLRRLKIGVRRLVSSLEDSTIAFLSDYGINAISRSDAPGVYVNGCKIASLGLRVRNGFSFHGISINFNMDLEPFSRINVCGYEGLEVTQLTDLKKGVDFDQAKIDLLAHLSSGLGYNTIRAFPGKQ